MLLTLLAVVTVAIVRQRNLFGVVVLAEHLQLPDGERADRARCRRRGDDRGLGRRRRFDRPPARHPASDQDDRDALDPAAACCRCSSSVGTGAVLVWGTLVLPPFGTPDAAIHKHVAPRYLADTIKETDVPNVVTSVLADYRGYDTLGETTVIFTAGIGVLLLLHGATAARPRRTTAESATMSLDLILRIGTKLHPAVHPAVRALRAVPRRLRPGRRLPGRRHHRRHGHPAMPSSSALTPRKRIAPQALVERMIPLGVLIYAGTGVAGLLLGKNYLDYSVLAHDPPHGHELGIFLVEAGVLITVAGTMTAHLLRLRRAGPLMQTLTDLRRPLQLRRSPSS